MDVVSLNYQGEGIGQSPEFEGTKRIRPKPQYPAFHKHHPDKVIVSSETACAFSSRGVYLFPVVDKISDIVYDGRGGDSLPLAWQWNHNPDNRFWSIGQRSGYYVSDEISVE